MEEPLFTAMDVTEVPPPWTRIVDVSTPTEEHQIGVWGYPLWLSAGDEIEAGAKRWRVLRCRLELPKLGQDAPRRAVLHVEVESHPD